MNLVANTAKADLARLSFDVLCMIWKSRLCVPISLLPGVGWARTPVLFLLLGSLELLRFQTHCSLLFALDPGLSLPAGI
jgi:hypothetical protein